MGHGKRMYVLQKKSVRHYSWIKNVFTNIKKGKIMPFNYTYVRKIQSLRLLDTLFSKTCINLSQHLFFRLFYLVSNGSFQLLYNLRNHLILQCVNFFLWWYLKANVYKGKPRTLELKTAIRKQIEKVEKEMQRKVYAHFQERLQSCVFENLMDVFFADTPTCNKLAQLYLF